MANGSMEVSELREKAGADDALREMIGFAAVLLGYLRPFERITGIPRGISSPPLLAG